MMRRSSAECMYASGRPDSTRSRTTRSARLSVSATVGMIRAIEPGPEPAVNRGAARAARRVGALLHRTPMLAVVGGLDARLDGPRLRREARLVARDGGDASGDPAVGRVGRGPARAE